MSVRLFPENFVSMPNLNTRNALTATMLDGTRTLLAPVAHRDVYAAIILLGGSYPSEVIAQKIKKTGAQKGNIEVTFDGDDTTIDAHIYAYCFVEGAVTNEEQARESFAFQAKNGNLRLSNPYLPKAVRS
ncbi:MAG: hypothetical protein LBI39_01595 [Puniceicoccales bacterium]|jgi:hypothetical protein|nr:hypothetical protein [Puniceicoccales bacterium]